MNSNGFQNAAPVARRVRAFFAPVNRATATPAVFDMTTLANFSLDAPPAPWVSLGEVEGLERQSQSKSTAVLTGVPAAVQEQVRETAQAQVSFAFLQWTKLTLALAAGSQHFNLLAETNGTANTAVTIQSGSTATSLVLSAADAAKFAMGDVIAVDVDYAGQTGFIGSPVSGAYLRQAVSNVDYVRRVTLNVARVAAVSATTLTLAEPLLGGVPVSSAKLQQVVGFADREGGSFYQEWSALLVMEGSQGERVFFYYPRLQNAGSAEEKMQALDAQQKNGQARVLLQSRFLALPVVDALDGERVVCYRGEILAE